MAEAATEQSIEKVTAELVKQTGLSQERVIDMKKQSDALKEQKKSLDAMKKGLETLGKVAERDAAYQKASNKYEKDKSSLEKKDQRISIKDRFTSIKNAAKDFKTQSNISKGITGLKTEFKSGLKGLGGSLASLGGFAKKSAGGILSFIGKAALFTFLPAIIGFLQSPLFEEMIDYITSTLVPAVFDLYNNIILPLGKALFELGPGPLGLLALGTYLTVKLLPKVFGLLPTVIRLGKAFVQIGFGLTKVALKITGVLLKYGLQKGGKLLLGLSKGIVALSGAFFSLGKGVFKAGGAILKSVPKLFDFKKLKAAFFALDSRVEKTIKGLRDSVKGGATKSIGAVGKFFGKTGPIVKFASKFGPIGLAVGAVIAALVGVYVFLTETKIGEKILGGIKDMFNSVIEFIGGIYTNHIKPMIDEALDFGASVLSGIFTPIINYISGIYTNVIKPKIDEALDFGASVISGIFDPILNFISGIYDRFIKPKLETAINFFKPVLDVINPIIDKIKNIFSKMFNAIRGFVANLIPEAVYKFLPDSLVGFLKKEKEESVGTVANTPTSAQTSSAQRTEVINETPQTNGGTGGQNIIVDSSARTVNNATTVQQASHFIVNPDPLLKQLTTMSI